MEVATAKFSLEEYHQMVEAGILAHRRVELVDGLIVEMPPEGTEHVYYKETLASLWRRLTEGRAWIREASPVTLSTSELQPDIVVVRLPRSLYLAHHPYPEDIYWLVEVSNSTLAFDTSAKRKTYATAGIWEYWVVNVSSKQLSVYRSPFEGDYQEVMTLEAEAVVSPLAFPDLAITVQQIFAS